MSKRNIKLLEHIVRKTLAEASGVNIQIPNSNLYVKGWGRDKNGNRRIVVGFPNDKGFSIQTNGVLPDTHHIIGIAHNELSEDELNVIFDEVIPYVQKYGTKDVKSRLNIRRR